MQKRRSNGRGTQETQELIRRRAVAAIKGRSMKEVAETFAEREIPLNNIFGVNLNPQSHEVVQLSLYLKLLEDETTVSAHQHYLDFHEALLPSLSKNVVFGNSLSGLDLIVGALTQVR